MRKSLAQIATATRAAEVLKRLGRSAMLATALTAPAMGAERDICEHKAGPDLIRCIEAAARSSATVQPPEAAKPTAPRTPAPSSATVSQPAPARVAPAPELQRPASEDCTGRSSDALRRCLAAGGHLSAEAATNAPAPMPSGPTPAARNESCEGKSGETLRTCIEAQSKRALAARKSPQPQIIPCTGYVAADQPLCLQRNTAIIQCRNRRLYPDPEVCLRSHMNGAPEPRGADCGKLQGRSRSHCEARNRVFASCTGDKMGYFACLEHHLGADAVLTRR